MSIRHRIIAPLLLLLGAAAVAPVTSAVAGPSPVPVTGLVQADDPSLVIRALTGPKLIVEPGRAGVSILSAEITAAPGKRVEGLKVVSNGGETLACPSVPAVLTGTTLVHCEQALPAIPAGSTRSYTFTATGVSEGRDVKTTLTFDVLAASLKTRLTVAGQVREDSPVGSLLAGPAVKPSSAVRAELLLTNSGTGTMEVAVAGWTCPGTSLAGGATMTCTRAVAAPAKGGQPGAIEAMIQMKDQDGRTGATKRYGKFQTAAVPGAGSELATTGLPVGGTLAVAAGLICLGLGARRLSRPACGTPE